MLKLQNDWRRVVCITSVMGKSQIKSQIFKSL